LSDSETHVRDTSKRQELERRRMQAGRLLQKGLRQSEVAHRLRVSRETVRRWACRVEHGGLTALKNAPRLGRPSGLSDSQRRELKAMLARGARAQGFHSDRWTIARARTLIERHFDRSYSAVQVWRILRALSAKPRPAAKRRAKVVASRKSAQRK
jgi:transposase